MALFDVLNEVSAEKKAKKPADKKYVTFTLEEWKNLEAKQGKEINPMDVKQIIIGIFEGRFNVSVVKPKTA
jgi:hypothetical protein